MKETIKETKTDEQEKINKLRELAYKYRIDSVQYNSRFLILKTQGLPGLLKLKKGELGVLLYLLSNINRDIGYEEKGGLRISHKVWGNLHLYYQQGFLATIRTQTRISEDTGYDQRNISRWLSSLIEHNYIKVPAYEKIRIANNIVNCPVFALGQLVDVGGAKEEMFYYEAI